MLGACSTKVKELLELVLFHDCLGAPKLRDVEVSALIAISGWHLLCSKHRIDISTTKGSHDMRAPLRLHIAENLFEFLCIP